MKLKRTNGALSETERGGLQRVALEREIASFFTGDRAEREDCRAFESASRASWARE